MMQKKAGGGGFMSHLAEISLLDQTELLDFTITDPALEDSFALLNKYFQQFPPLPSVYK